MISTTEAPSIQRMKMWTLALVGEAAVGDEAAARRRRDRRGSPSDPTGRPCRSRTAGWIWLAISSGSARVSGSRSSKNVCGIGGGSGPGGSNSTSMWNRSAAIACRRSIVGAGRQRAVEIDDRADVARHRRRQPVGDEIPMALHEDIGDRRLQQHHRQDDDQQRAGVEALGQQIRRARARPQRQTCARPPKARCSARVAPIALIRRRRRR